MIAHLCTRAAWEAGAPGEPYRPDSLDVEGFIHCSGSEQVLSVANTFYRGRRDLILLWIDPDRLRAPLRWEAPAHPPGGDPGPKAGSRFPHLYGPLNRDAVAAVAPFDPDGDGVFREAPLPEPRAG